jgi:hypothetical protein
VFEEIRRVVKPGGVVMIYEHNPLNLLTVRAVRTCPFDENAILISARTLIARLTSAGFREVEVKYRVFFPKALSALRPLEAWLVKLPLGAQYYVQARK